MTLTNVSNALLTAGYISKPLTKAHCETYGRKTYAFFSVADLNVRYRCEAFLNGLGVEVNRHYCRVSGNCPSDTPRLSVRVGYLRAHGWQD